jgi:hypothetical protein
LTELVRLAPATRLTAGSWLCAERAGGEARCEPDGGSLSPLEHP